MADRTAAATEGTVTSSCSPLPHGEVFDGTPLEMFGSLSPDLTAKWDRTIALIEEAERASARDMHKVILF